MQSFCVIEIQASGPNEGSHRRFIAIGSSIIASPQDEYRTVGTGSSPRSPTERHIHRQSLLQIRVYEFQGLVLHSSHRYLCARQSVLQGLLLPCRHIHLEVQGEDTCMSTISFYETREKVSHSYQTTWHPARRPASTPGTESSKTKHSSGLTSFSRPSARIRLLIVSKAKLNISGSGLPRPTAILGSSPRTLISSGNTAKTSLRWLVLSSKFPLCDDVARAMGIPARDRVCNNDTTPGNGCVDGKCFCCRAATLVIYSSRDTGNCAQSAKIFPAAGL